jgi:amino acid adenylation domain-containing protein
MMEETANVFQGSPQQDEQWRADPQGPLGRVQAVLSVDGLLESGALQSALRNVAERHEILRTTFVHRPGIRIPLQAVADELEPAVAVGSLESAAASEEIGRVLASERAAPLSFEHGPLLRALLLSFAADRHLLVITLSSLCADLSSMPVLAAEIAYQLGAGGPPVDDPLQYADFAAWQAELAQADDAQALAARDAWSKLSGASSPMLPFAGRRSPRPALDEVSVELPDGTTSATVHAGWHALLSRLTGEQCVVVPYLSAERPHEDLEGAVGAFARPVPLAIEIDEATSFASLLALVEAGRRGCLELQDYAPDGAGSELTIGFCEYDSYRTEAGRLTIELERALSTAAPWTLCLACERGGAPGTAWMMFDPVAHPRAWVQRLARELSCIVSSAVAEPDAPIASLELLDAAERAEILEQFGRGPQPASRAAHIPALVARHAAAAPDRPAVHDGERSLTYGELDARANKLAHRLREGGAGTAAPVGLCMDRSVEMLVGLLGILKAGAAYLPLNHEHPAARLGQQLSSAGAVAVLTTEELLERVPEGCGEILCLDRDRDRAEIDAAPSTAPAVDLADDDLAYVIYTSGSTGQPKGVAVTHGNLANYAGDIVARLGADREPMSFGAVTAISTDLGNTSVFGALASGGTLVLVSPARAADAAAFSAQLEATPVDILKVTPSHLGALLAAGDPGVLPRRTLVLGGERAPWDLVERVRALSDCEIINHYGPTETTIGCCTFAVPEGPGAYAPATVPIGQPIAGTTCYVLDSRMQPVPTGTPGTLFVGGAGVARGYLGQPELTSEVFVDDPLDPASGSRLYNTGDVVRWLPDGALEFLGRADEQVKIRGYRVEPAEVETVLRRDPRVSEAIVLAPLAPNGDRRLVAYYTTPGGAIGQDELRERLAAQLPEFMIPSAIVALETVPRTPSGKIDRRSLPDPETVTATSSVDYTAPSSPTEIALAAIFAQTLGVRRVGREDDFFDLGGHSLLATQVVAQIRSELAVELPLAALFTSPTVALLSAEVLEMMGASDATVTSELLAELESLSDEEVQQLLAGEDRRPDGDR